MVCLVGASEMSAKSETKVKTKPSSIAESQLTQFASRMWVSSVYRATHFHEYLHTAFYPV